MYDLIQQLGQTLRDSRPTYDENEQYVAPTVELSKDAQTVLENKINLLIKRISKYLDQCGLKPEKPLWHYDRKNPETHASERDFKYGHLLENVV